MIRPTNVRSHSHRSLLPLGLALVPLGAALSYAAQDETEGERARRYFAIADYDGSGWISFAEAGQALLISREEFFSYDADRDGGIDAAEFEARYRRIVETQGLFQPPIPAPTSSPSLPTPTRVWFERFDTDKSGSWDVAELTLALDERGLAGLVTPEVFDLLDANSTERLEPEEIDTVLKLAALATPVAPARAASVRELFGAPLPTPVGPGVVPSPARVPGPLPVYERLDVDGDGWLDAGDLRDLAFPAALPIRPESLLAALDRDGDGRLSRAEYERALLSR